MEENMDTEISYGLNNGRHPQTRRNPKRIYNMGIGKPE